jgi:hypothetical protein
MKRKGKGKAKRGQTPLSPPKPKRITHSGNETAVEWDDGTKTVVRCMQDDHPDNYAAFCAAFAKRVYGDNGTVKRLWKSAEVTEPEPLKVGDKVRVLDGSKIPDYYGKWIDGMAHYIGKIYTVAYVNYDSNRVDLAETLYVWDRRGLEKIKGV